MKQLLIILTLLLIGCDSDFGDPDIACAEAISEVKRLEKEYEKTDDPTILEEIELIKEDNPHCNWYLWDK